MNGPSSHLTWHELACKDGTAYPAEYITDGRVIRLSYVFEEIRRLCGDKPIEIWSAFRTINYNRKICGAFNSQHIHGRALDLHHTTLKNTDFYKIIWNNRIELGLGGLGLYNNFVHIDIRDANTLVCWRGKGIKDTPV